MSRLNQPLNEIKIRELNRVLGITPEMLTRFEFQSPADPNFMVTVGKKDRPDDDDYGDQIMLRHDAAWAFQRLQEAAAIDGIVIRPLSGYRSVERQKEIIAKKISAGIDIKDILIVNTPPGFSEHNTGKTIDIGGFDQNTDLESSFKNTKEYNWLKENAAKFGFCFTYEEGNKWGIIPEPWHITYDPAKDGQFSLFAENSEIGSSSQLYNSIIALPERILTGEEYT